MHDGRPAVGRPSAFCVVPSARDAGVDGAVSHEQIVTRGSHLPTATCPMFGITHRHTVDHAPAFPNPSLRFPDGTPIPIYAGEEQPADTKDQPTPDESPAPEPESP